MKMINRLLSTLILGVFGLYCQAHTGWYWLDFNSDNPTRFVSEEHFVQLLSSEKKDNKLHYLTVQVVGNDNQISPPYTKLVTLSDTAYNFDLNVDGILPQGVMGKQMDVENVATGFHSLIISESRGLLPNQSFVFLRKPISSEGITLQISSDRANASQYFDVSKSQTLVVDVETFPLGYNKLNISSVTTKDKSHIGSFNTLFYNNPLGGNHIAEIRLYNVARDKYVSFGAGLNKTPFSISEEVNISSLDSISSKYFFKIFDEKPFESPILNMYVSALDSRGFVLDSISTYVDNSHAVAITPVKLPVNEQYDFAMPVDSLSLWASIDNLATDSINFRARYDCSTILYSPKGETLDSIQLTKDSDNFSYFLPEDGRYYINISDIKKTSRQFSVRYNILSGPSSESILSRPTFEGELVRWNNVSEWQISSNQGDFSGANANITVSSSGNGLGASFDEQTSECRLNHSGKLVLTSKDYFTKVIFVPELLESKIGLNVNCSNGNLSLDKENNVIVWEGFSKSITLSPDSLLEDIEANARPLNFREIYITYAPMNSDELQIDFDPTGNYEYGDGYNTLFILFGNGESDKYNISNDLKLIFTANQLEVSNSEVCKTYSAEDGVTLLYEMDITSSIKTETVDSQPLVKVENGNLVFSDMPNEISIYQVNGIMVYSQVVNSDTFKLPISDFSKGIYIIRIGRQTAKIVIK